MATIKWSTIEIIADDEAEFDEIESHLASRAADILTRSSDAQNLKHSVDLKDTANSVWS